MNYLVGDIGGTNTRLLLSKQNGDFLEKDYFSQNFNSLNDVIDKFYTDYNIDNDIDAACFAIAGPIENGSVSVTNLPWVVDEEQLKHHLRATRVKLVNDFYAVAKGISKLDQNDIVIVQQGKNPVNSNIAIIGAGTGLGAAHIIIDSNNYNIYTSEAGHAGFSPENTLQSELLLWMQQQYNHVSLEMLLSGKGLLNIYNFFKTVKGINESENVKSAIMQNITPRIITEVALKNGDELCRKTLSCFIDIYGAATGNIALHYYPVGEVYIAGGIAAKIKDKILSPAFIKGFINKGLLTEKMKNITVKLITQEKVGLFGALSILK